MSVKTFAISFATRLARFMALGCFSLLVAEGAAFVALRLTAETWPSWDDLAAERQAAAQVERLTSAKQPRLRQAHRDRAFFGTNALHPFLGFVARPPEDPSRFSAQSLELGFPQVGSMLFEPAPDRVVVGVFGGSVASIFAEHGGAALARELGHIPRFAGKRIEVVGIALGGFKQPQSLMAYNYLLALGGHFDVVITLDGFNEVALAPAEMEQHRIFPAFPRDWRFRAGPLEPTLRRAMGRVDFLQETRRERAKAFSAPLPAHSFTAGLVFRLLDRTTAARIATEELELKGQAEAARDFQTRGPRRAAISGRDLYQDLALYWLRSSWQMWQLAHAQGSEYYHFLQPNQYVEGSKPLAPEELEKAWQADHYYRPGVVHGYPLLLRLGAAAAEAGLPFHDLTQVFHDVREPLYYDPCCHFNPRGNRLLAVAVAGLIARAPAPPPVPASGRIPVLVLEGRPP